MVEQSVFLRKPCNNFILAFFPGPSPSFINSWGGTRGWGYPVPWIDPDHLCPTSRERRMKLMWTKLSPFPVFLHQLLSLMSISTTCHMLVHSLHTVMLNNWNMKMYKICWIEWYINVLSICVCNCSTPCWPWKWVWCHLHSVAQTDYLYGEGQIDQPLPHQ